MQIHYEILNTKRGKRRFKIISQEALECETLEFENGSGEYVVASMNFPQITWDSVYIIGNAPERRDCAVPDSSMSSKLAHELLSRFQLVKDKISHRIERTSNAVTL